MAAFEPASLVTFFVLPMTPSFSYCYEKCLLLIPRSGSAMHKSTSHSLAKLETTVESTGFGLKFALTKWPPENRLLCHTQFFSFYFLFVTLSLYDSSFVLSIAYNREVHLFISIFSAKFC